MNTRTTQFEGACLALLTSSCGDAREKWGPHRASGRAAGGRRRHRWRARCPIRACSTDFVRSKNNNDHR
eukprot:11154547-Lingulodinium_polyedra.AAC.1